MIPDYELADTLSADAAFELRRGRRVRTDAPVLVKVSRAEALRPLDMAALRRECALAVELGSGPTLLPRVIEFRERCALVMEDPGGELLPSLLAAARLPLDWVLEIGTQLALALGDLHRRGVVHHGLRPEAVMFDAANRRTWLIDLGDAGALAARRPAGSVPALVAQRLVYAAPEQSGRMDRAVDQRSDLYALGVLLYELLCGAPPFEAGDALELIHKHLAAAPIEPTRQDPTIPPAVSAIVMRLLAKTPDERYQTANGVADDLRRCAREWAESRHIEPFTLGQRDASGELTVSSKLYGREPEVAELLAAFERCCQAERGHGEMLLVEGYAGIGKTALIQRLYRPIVRQRGYFISGKFDQVVRGVPFGALIQAFRGLVQQLLTETEAQLTAWRETLTKALGANGGVLAEVIPEIEFIVGAQSLPVALGSAEAQNRFQRVLQNFVAALARPEHPMVLFLDDLQWADAATLGLLEPLLTSGESRSLLLVGACRDNELDAAPRLARTLATLSSAGVGPRRITLGPLNTHELTELVADTLRCDAGAAAPLAALIARKTGGNPFFVTQFLKSLEREGHLRFDVTDARWVYRIDEIADAPLADNVIDLMTRSIQRLPSKSQYALTLAACIGNRFERDTLAIVSEQTPAQTDDDLAQAIGEGLLVVAAPSSRQVLAPAAAAEAQHEPAAYGFLHDRVQQAAYGMIPQERRRMVHLTVGRLLRSRIAPGRLDAGLFDVLQHLNLGRGLITNRVERIDVARLNLEAGRKAKSSTAHDTALELFQAGIDLLDAAAAWDSEYELSFALHLEAAECRYLCGQFDAALAHLTQLLERARTPLDRARVVRLRSVQLENMGRYADSIATTRAGIALFGVSFPDAEHDKLHALENEIESIEALRGDRSIAALVELAPMSDPQIRMVMSMLTGIWSATYLVGDPTLARLISATLVRLSLQHGNAEESAYGYVTHAITVGAVRGKYAQAYEYGRLALAVNQRFDDSSRRAKIYQQFHAHVNLWCRPYASGAAYAREACRAGLESGDFLYAAYAAGTEPWAAMAATQDLAQFERDHEPSIALIEKLKNRGFADSVRVLVNWSRALRGRTDQPLSLGDASLDEAAYLRTYRDTPIFTTIHAIARLQLCWLLGSSAETLAAARHAGAYVHHLPGTVWPVMFDFWNALTLAANHADASNPDEAQAWLAALNGSRIRFEALAAHCAQNFRCPALLLAGEIARIEGRENDALVHYGQALEYASDQSLLLESALANELCGCCLLGVGRSAAARMHLAQARAAYAQWGASAKVNAMQRQYPVLAARGAAAQAHDSASAVAATGRDEAALTSGHGVERVDRLDLFSVSKAAQAIAAEVEFDELLARLMRITIESAGAERGAFVLESEAGPQVYAGYALDDRDPAAPSEPVPLEQSQQVPVGIVNYVRRTSHSVVLAQADADERHAGDPYIMRCRPRSVMCVAVQKQARLIGVLYLENRGVGAAFSAERLRVLQILSAQAAISLENAQLFARQRSEIAERVQAQAALASALAEVERLRLDLEAENSYLRRDLIANVSHDLRTPLVSIRGYLEVLAVRGDALEPAQRRSYLDTAVRQSEHLGTLIDELFELAKLDFKGVTLQRESFQLAELVCDVLQKFQLMADGKQVALQLDTDTCLQPVHADLSLVERALDNLIGNALKHTQPGGRVKVELSQGENEIEVRVVDSGAGIAAADLPFIFDRFYRAGTHPHAAAGGAGLGLAITKRIVELHSGSLCVESSAEGSRFRFSLPVAKHARAALD